MYSTPGKPLPERPRPSGNLPNLPHLKSARKSLFGLSLVNDFSQDLDEQENSSNNNTFETPIARSSMKQKVTFAHDPDLDSTPFVYIRHTKSESSDSPSITNSRNIPTPALNVEPAVDMLSTRFSNINMEASTTNITNPSEEDEDLFGLGAFSDNFISESEIEASAQKLGEEERRSQAKVHSEYTQLLGEWAVENAIDENVISPVSLLSSRCRICVNFVIIGVGQLMFHQQTLHWSGNTIDGQACFGFPSIIECKPKCLNGELPMIILSLQHNRSIQFQFEDLDEQKVEEISKTIKCNETQQQQQQSLTSEDEIKRLDEELERRIEELKREFEMKKKQITNTENGECTLCYTNRETIRFMPCRHCICDSCYERLQESSQSICPWDRQSVETIVRIE